MDCHNRTCVVAARSQQPVACADYTCMRNEEQQTACSNSPQQTHRNKHRITDLTSWQAVVGGCTTVRRHLRDEKGQPKHCMTTHNIIHWSTNRHQHPLRVPGTANRQPKNTQPEDAYYVYISMHASRCTVCGSWRTCTSQPIVSKEAP